MERSKESKESKPPEGKKESEGNLVMASIFEELRSGLRKDVTRSD